MAIMRLSRVNTKRPTITSSICIAGYGGSRNLFAWRRAIWRHVLSTFQEKNISTHIFSPVSSRLRLRGLLNTSWIISIVLDVSWKVFQNRNAHTWNKTTTCLIILMISFMILEGYFRLILRKGFVLLGRSKKFSLPQKKGKIRYDFLQKDHSRKPLYNKGLRLIFIHMNCKS